MKQSLIIFNIGESKNIDFFIDTIQKSFMKVKDGGFILVMFDTPYVWESNICWEGKLNTIFRTNLYNDKFWEYFGSGAIRYYNREDRNLKATSNWLLYRKPGEKIYREKALKSRKTLQDSKLDTLNRVFTRDVANNVWHYWIDNKCKSEFLRFASLLMWPDDDGQIISESEIQQLKSKKMNYNNDVIGVPTKTLYSWDGNLDLIGLVKND